VAPDSPVITSGLVVGLLFGSLAVTLGLADLDAVTDEPTNRKSAMAAVVLGIVAIVIGLAAPVFRIWLIV
jgi:putative effector of murein hydrolase